MINNIERTKREYKGKDTPELYFMKAVGNQLKKIATSLEAIEIYITNDKRNQNGSR